MCPPHFDTAQRNFQSTFVAWSCSGEVCPVTAARIWAFSPGKSVFPGLLRKGPTLPLLGRIEWREGRWAFEPRESLLHQTLSSEATCCPVPIGPAGECVLVWECPRKGTRLPLLSGYCKADKADVGVMFSKHRVTLVHWVIRPLGPHVLNAPP